MVKRTNTLFAVLATAFCCLVIFGCQEPPRALTNNEPLTFGLGPERSFYPWQGKVRISSLEANPGETWYADFDIVADLRELKGFPDVVEGLVVALVGEQVFDAKGTLSGFTGLAISNRFTSAGIPIDYYTGTLPVRALGSRQGSPLEAIMEFPAGPWAKGGRAHLKGRLAVKIPEDLPPGYYRPHIDIFAKFKGSNTPIDLGHLPYQLGQWLDANVNVAGAPGAKMFALDIGVPMPIEFMQDPQVLPEVKIGEPAPPRQAWTIFHDVSDLGQSGLLPKEDAEQVGLLTRVRLPTPLTLLPRNYMINPGLPHLFPEMGLAELFIGIDTIPAAIKNYMDFGRGRAECTLVFPNGDKKYLGEKRFVGNSIAGPRLEGGGFALDLMKTGDYKVILTGAMYDVFGREYKGGGTYEFTVAMPLSFSTPVKPGTNYLVGSAIPASAHINPPSPADVTMEVHYFPNSDKSREKVEVFKGKANRFGHFVPDRPPLFFTEPGEYRSLVVARYVDKNGVLWQGAQASAGVISPGIDRDMVLHGGRTYLSPPNPLLPDYGGYERYDSEFEGGSSYIQDELLCQFDFIFPYYSGDTLFISTTYPFESVVGIVLAMEARVKELAKRLVESYNPEGVKYNFPITPRNRTPSFLPDVFKFAEDNFAYYRISEEHPDHFPIMSSNSKGLSPFIYPQYNDLEAYAYVSVFRPGFPVMTLAFSGTFMGSCWIVSPNPYGGQINASPNGDLPGDLYRVNAGLVLKDKVTGKNYYDTYSVAIVATGPATYRNSVSAPGERPLVWKNGRELPYFIGMDTSESYIVGDKMIVGGTVMPPVEANVRFVITKPDGTQEVIEGRSQRLGGFSPPRPILIDQPGVYKLKGRVERDGIVGDISGSGDGEFYNFAVPENAPELLDVGLEVVTSIAPDQVVSIPLSWPEDIQDVMITYSIMMPGQVLDEGERRVEGGKFDFNFRPDQFAIQYPLIDTVDHATGKKLLADTIVFVFFIEGTRNGEKVYDVVRLILRGRKIFNSRAKRKTMGQGHHNAPVGHPNI